MLKGFLTIPKGFFGVIFGIGQLRKELQFFNGYWFFVVFKLDKSRSGKLSNLVITRIYSDLFLGEYNGQKLLE